MNWLNISSIEEWNELIDKNRASKDEVIAIFKHSTRCSISSMAKNRLESSWQSKNPETSIYLIDLIANRNLSNEIAQTLNVEHQSPQLILLKNGKSIYDSSHISISSQTAANYI